MADQESSDEPAVPTAFVSYSHDSSEHQAWVLGLAHRLQGHGVKVVLDRWDMAPGKDLPKFMEQGLSSSEWVIAICTAAYNEKANTRAGGVGYESRIITADLFAGADLQDHVIPVPRDPDAMPPVPTFLAGLLWVDMRTDTDYDASYSDLLRRILDEPAVPKPELGKNPFARRDGELWVPLEHRADRYVLPAGEGRIEFPYENNSGQLVLGTGDYRFTTRWSGRSAGVICFLNDPPDIHSVALSVKPGSIDAVGDAFSFDASSRLRDASAGDVALFRNTNDYWLAVFVEGVTLRDRADPDSVAMLTGTYRILDDRASVFDG